MDFIAACLAATICVSIGGSLAIQLFVNAPLGAEQAKALASVVSATISIVSMYVGAAIQKSRDKE